MVLGVEPGVKDGNREDEMGWSYPANGRGGEDLGRKTGGFRGRLRMRWIMWRMI